MMRANRFNTLGRFKTSVRLLLVAGVGVLLSSVALPAKAPHVVIRLGQVTYKENGRIDKRVIAECEVDKTLRAAVDAYNVGDKPKKRISKPSRETVAFDVDLQIDKIAPVGWNGSANAMGAGTELGVTVLVPATSGKQLFLCRTDWHSGAACSRFEKCGKKITDQIAAWLAQQGPVPAPR